MVAALVQGLRRIAVTVIPKGNITHSNKRMTPTPSAGTCCELEGLGTGPAMSFNITAQYFLDEVEAFQWAMCIGYTVAEIDICSASV